MAGKTGAVTLAKADVGLGNVDNTSDADKPISALQQGALAGKVDTVRQVNTGNGLTGGGNLSSNRTLAADFLTKAEAQAGQSAVKVASALSMEQHMLANDLGWGQTWQTPAPARAAVTIYTNDTARPIMVSLGISSATGRYVQVSPDGVTWINVGYTLSLYAAAQFIVPVGWRYRINGTGTIAWWSELR